MSAYDMGILTFWDVPNYGTFAQAYALQCALAQHCKERDVRQIAYLNQKHYDAYYAKKTGKNFLRSNFYKNMWDIVNPKSNYNQRKATFPKYYLSIPHTERLTASELDRTKFDTLILGSDIIWDYSFEIFDNDPRLFGVGIHANKKISYAASFGTIKPGDDYPQYVIDGVKDLDFITVRDENSADIVKEITGERPSVVLDPTWLWDFNMDTNVVVPDYEDYVIVYGQDFSNEFIDQLCSYAKDHHLQLICLDCNNDQYEWCDVLIHQSDLTPFEWIGLFRHSSAIATSTFHGLTFSLIFNKKLAFCASDFILAKADNFLKKLGLYDLLSVKGRDAREMLDYDWDYSSINAFISTEREKSLKLITSTL
ncbi:polysaccharide pyruvyl transferase family protein [Bifidobacterium tissieri]|uniref:Polysaccharide pyruvyl transferase family protein n=1 Tax=Bifidobacterium tissieri TaxID=1630162 RepID=A0A5M9ZHH1_9BIFI|nr:polysaccharide pyruvyl transferase family protein [Bifidobacterium tissieri]KAA8827010.1 polysaccharide pyruvyl transferase family protein [Bifidobacterium tissieri]